MHASYSASVDGDREDLVLSHVLQRQLYGSVLTCEERGRGRPKQGGGKVHREMAHDLFAATQFYRVVYCADIRTIRSYVVMP